MKNIRLFLTLILVINASAMAIEPKDLSDLDDQSLSSKVDQTFINDLGDMNDQLDYEGLDDSEIEEIIADAYTSKEMIKKCLDRRVDFNLSDRLKYLDHSAGEIIVNSDNNEDELYLRKTLKRTRDMVRSVISISGANHDETVRSLTTFYVGGMNLAYAVVNNNTEIHGALDDLPGEYTDYLNRNTFHISSAEFGRMHALRMWSHSQGLKSDASKGVFLIKLVQYLVDDLASDTRVRKNVIKSVLRDAYGVTKNPYYVNVLSSLKNREVPKRSQLDGLRVEVYRLIRALNVAL